MKCLQVFAFLSSAIFYGFVQLTSSTQIRGAGKQPRVMTASVAGTPLPPNAEATLRRVQREVKSLPVPARTKQNATIPMKTGGTLACKFLGGLARAELTAQCCTNVQVVTQRHLDQYGMASKCKPGWECEADGVAPLPAFETRSLSALCGEPGCLPAVIAAVKKNPLTAVGAEEMSGICANLASLGGSSADPEVVSEILSGGGGKGPKGRKGKGKKKRKSAKKRKSPSCFPGVATVHVRGAGELPLDTVKAGTEVLVQRGGQLVYEPILTFLHAVKGNHLPFITIHHERGMFRASAGHVVFIATNGERNSWTSTLVANLRVGDKIFAAEHRAEQINTKLSAVTAIRHGDTASSMFAPLTASGSIVVDAVVASNYASPSERRKLPHTLAHMFLFPVRMYHQSGFARVWQRLCGRNAVDVRDGAEFDELHPYLKMLWKGLNVDVLLPSQ